MRVVVAVLATAVVVLTLLPIFHVGPSARIPLHVAPALAESAKAMSLELQQSVGKSVRFIGRDTAGLPEKIAALLSPPPLAGSRLPLSTPASNGEGAGNELFLVEVGETLELRDLPDGRGGAVSVKVDLLTFRRYYIALNEEKRIAGKAVREMWSWESAPYADYTSIARIEDATLRNGVVAGLAARGLNQALELPNGAPPAFYKLTASLPWIAPDPAHIPIGKRMGKVFDLNRKKDMTAVYSISPNTGGSFLHKHPVPAHAAEDGEFPSGFEVFLKNGSDGKRQADIRIVTAAQGRFNGNLSHEQSLVVPLPDDR